MFRLLMRQVVTETGAMGSQSRPERRLAGSANHRLSLRITDQWEASIPRELLGQNKMEPQQLLTVTIDNRL